MKQITLSDHTGDQIRQAEAARHASYQRDQDIHRAKVQAIAARRVSTRQALALAWQRRQLGRVVTGIIAVIGARLSKQPAEPVLQRAGRDEVVWATGHDGEQQLTGLLAGQLGPDWIAFSGYRNRKGEVDLLVLGPDGLLGIEIKHVNGVIHGHGDIWTRDKIDRYGHLVERGVPLADRRGRGPSRQVNEACAVLREFLTRRQVTVPFLTAVVFTHERVRMGQIQSPTVAFVGEAAQLDVRALLATQGAQLTPADVQRLARLIEQDHAYHAKPPHEKLGEVRRRA